MSQRYLRAPLLSQSSPLVPHNLNSTWNLNPQLTLHFPGNSQPKQGPCPTWNFQTQVGWGNHNNNTTIVMDVWYSHQTNTWLPRKDASRPGLSDIFFKDTSDMYTILGHIGDMYTIYDIFEEPHFWFKKNPQKSTRTFPSLTVLTLLTVTVLTVPTVLIVPTVLTVL